MRISKPLLPLGINIRLTFDCPYCIMISAGAKEIGGVAHLGERLNGIQEVVGSIPIVSTNL